MLKNDINYILIIKWLEFESHHPHLFDKNQIQGNVKHVQVSNIKDFHLKRCIRE
jgi:hypothetical protein